MHLAPFTGLRITNPQRHTMFFTATWPMSIRRLASEFLRNPAPWRCCDQVFQWTQWTCLWNKSECDECTFSPIVFGPCGCNMVSPQTPQSPECRFPPTSRPTEIQIQIGNRDELKGNQERERKSDIPFILKSWYIHINGETFPVSTTDE